MTSTLVVVGVVVAVVAVLLVWKVARWRPGHVGRAAPDPAEQARLDEMYRQNKRTRKLVRGMKMAEVRRDFGPPDNETTFSDFLAGYSSVVGRHPSRKVRGRNDAVTSALYGDTPANGYDTFVKHLDGVVIDVSVEQRPR